MNAVTSTESRALELLGQGLSNTVVATALGISESRVSQLLSDEEFSKKVRELRYQNLQKHNKRDNSYDELEDKVLKKLHQAVDFVTKPLELTRIMQVVNSAKRRGTSAPEALTVNQTVVNLSLPNAILQKYNVVVNNQSNQVVQAGSQNLTTIQASSLKKLLGEKPNGGSELQRIGSAKAHPRTTQITAEDL